MFQHASAAARMLRSGSVLITPPLSRLESRLLSVEIAIHSRPRISILHDVPLPEPAPEMRGGLPPVRTQRICEYISAV